MLDQGRMASLAGKKDEYLQKYDKLIRKMKRKELRKKKEVEGRTKLMRSFGIMMP